MDIRVWDLNSHSATAQHFGIVDGPERDDWREFHYTPAGQIKCRVLAADSHTAHECESAMRAQWPLFWDFLRACADALGTTTLYLSGATIPAGMKLPASVTTLYLSGATIPAGLKLPASVTNLYLSYATIPAGLKLPASVTTLYLSGATIPWDMTIPAGCKVYK